MNRDGGLGYELGGNEFADLTHQEFAARYTYTRRGVTRPTMVITTSAGDVKEGRVKKVDLAAEDIPASVDWRKKGGVTHAKDQLECASAWAFAVVATVETESWATKGRQQLVSLSEQQLIDCYWDSKGCVSYSMDPLDASDYIADSGITTEANYPYQGMRGRCNTSKVTEEAATIETPVVGPARAENKLPGFVAAHPAVVSMDASGLNFQLYKSGVYAGPCYVEGNHYVTLVGYGENDDVVKYLIAKNSWGQTWGDEGFFLIRRGVGDTGMCGIAVDPVSAI